MSTETAIDSAADRVIEITGSLEPNPLSITLIPGSIVKIHFELTLRSKIPFTFHVPSSFLGQNPVILGRFTIYSLKSGKKMPGMHFSCYFPGLGPLVNPEKDIITLYPGIPISRSVSCKIYTSKRANGREEPLVFGSFLSQMEAGESYVFYVRGGIPPILWCYWGTKEEVIEKYKPFLDENGAFQAPPPRWDDLPTLSHLQSIKFMATE